MLLATTFALLAIFVAWLRRGAFGRRLLAMKDSPAACATVGMNLTFTKLAVFSISAGMAGIGGALIGGLQRSTNPQDWQFAAGLPVFMVGVVGGIARIGGPLFAGISLATLVAMPDVADPAQRQLVPEPRRGDAGFHGHRPRPQPERSGRRHPRGVRPAPEAQGRLRDVPRRRRGALHDRARRPTSARGGS